MGDMGAGLTANLIAFSFSDFPDQCRWYATWRGGVGTGRGQSVGCRE